MARLRVLKVELLLLRTRRVACVVVPTVLATAWVMLI
jgi:hypothetical protein